MFMRIPKHIQFLGWNLDHKALELNNEGTRKVMIAKDMVKSVICCKVWFRKLHVSDYCVYKYLDPSHILVKYLFFWGGGRKNSRPVKFPSEIF